MGVVSETQSRTLRSDAISRLARQAVTSSDIPVAPGFGPH